MRKSKSPANCAAVRVQAFLQAAVLHSFFCAICSTFLSPFMRTRNLCTHCFKQTASSTHVGRRLKISISPVDILLPPPSVLHKRHKLFLKNEAVQLRDFLSQVRPLHRGSTASAFFGGSLFQQMMRMGPAWTCVPYSLARPVSLRTQSALLTALWVSEAVKQNKRKRLFAKVVMCENKVPWETREVRFSDLSSQLLRATGEHGHVYPSTRTWPEFPCTESLPCHCPTQITTGSWAGPWEQEEKSCSPAPLAPHIALAYSHSATQSRHPMCPRFGQSFHLLSSNKAVEVEPNKTEGMKSWLHRLKSVLTLNILSNFE